MKCFLSFFRCLPTSGPQRWQNLQAAPSLQLPFLYVKSHGLHRPKWWPAEPTDKGATIPASKAGGVTRGTALTAEGSGSDEREGVVGLPLAAWRRIRPGL
mmetsp:Transcript_26191/g.72042  ORF Transcript_26191/g.72042 Transcript_26191/m.72042 type:complete len:100 (+) Transcript_26191:506-805(+)